ncbi:MAG: hypothetical protein CMB99_07505 [Flavobacteriaceae bacterium]|nr:hypothetical protein [Flavobacteriaceae bacterium]|tara:strand:+ start:97919 stop:98626 length:708 start_codon:yes stop_codon:yes gene_type:complete
MIKFFRKIRQSLLAKNKFSNYLIYAFGEIVLVIIGILLALQINSWNEQKKIEAELWSSLHDMTEELEENIQFLNKSKQSFETRFLRVKKLKENKASDTEISQLLSYIGQDFDTKPFNKVFEFIKNEKSLKLIQDKELVKSINQFYEYSLTGLDRTSQWHQGFVRNNIDPYILENIPSERGVVAPKNAKILMKQLKFQNILNYQSLFYEAYVNACSKVISEAKELKKDITAYLKQE